MAMIRNMLATGCLSLGLAMGVGPLAAQTVTPPQVYQAIETVNAQLAAFHVASGTSPATDSQAPAFTERSPRHALQKAREVLLKVQTLRALYGLPEQPVPEIPVRNPGPAEVKSILDKVIGGLQELRPLMGNPPPPATPPLVEGKTPTDNVAGLRRAELQLDGLGLPPTAPNEVMRIALSIVSDLEKVRAARGIGGMVPAVTVVPGKKPVDTYNQAYELLVDLKQITEGDSTLAIPKGVVLPNKRSGDVSAAHVLDMLGSVLAEVSAIKVKVGATQPTQLAAVQAGKTPSDVFATLAYAQALVATLKSRQG